MKAPDPGPSWPRRAQRPGGLRTRLRDLFDGGPGLVLAPLLCLILAAQYFLLPDFGLAFALSADALRQGRWWTPLTSMFLHGGILHLVMNLTAFMSLQRPARLEFAPGPRGHLAFAGLYLVAGLAGSAVYLAFHPGGATPMLGASGAICGLWGAASRLATREGELTRLNDRQVWLNVRNFTVMNLVLVALISGPALLFGDGGEAQGGIAWEGHLGGFLAGLLLVPFFQRWSGWTPPPPPPWWETDAGPGPWSGGRAGLSVPQSGPPGERPGR